MQNNSSRHSPATQAAHRDVDVCSVGSVRSVGSVGICKHGKVTLGSPHLYSQTLYIDMIDIANVRSID